jgi:hypothetical protein
MKFVVMGLSGAEWPRITSRSALNRSSMASEEKRLKSSCCVGFGKYGVRRGGITSAQSENRCDQNAVAHESFSTSRDPYRFTSQSRNASAEVSHQHAGVCAPYSLPTCHMTTASWSAYRWEIRSASASALSR